MAESTSETILEPGKLSFRQRVETRLREESGNEKAPEGYEDGTGGEDSQEEGGAKVGDGYDEALDPAKTDEEESSDDSETDQATKTDGSETGADEGEDSDEGETPGALTVVDVAERLQIDPAEFYDKVTVPVGDYGEQMTISALKDRYNGIQSEYATKAQSMAEAITGIERFHDEVETEASFFESLAEQSLSVFDKVNWTELQSEPEKYQSTRQEFAVAVKNRDQLVAASKELKTRHKQALKEMKDKEASLSREILSFKVPSWSNDLYTEMRTFAVERLNYSAEEFDDISDWRRIRDIHAQFVFSQAPKNVEELRKAKAKRKPDVQKQRRAAAQGRNSKGEFASSRQNLYDNPGDRDARRQYFQKKMEAERR